MLKYDKDHLCPSCQLGKSKKASHPLKAENTNTEVLHTLHMDLCGWFESVGISHETSVPRSPQQNGVVERRKNLWAEAVATACYTLNRSLVHTLHGKTYYELLKGKKPNL
ncbi:integrase, catalytic region, zinc finger, CCHC-type containing protein [Tanacetum coccineum]